MNYKMTVDILDSVFSELRARIVPLVKQIAESEHRPETAFLYKEFPKEKQHKLNLEILKQLGYDFKAGRLDETVHPFEIRINRGDVRVTTRYDENDFRGQSLVPSMNADMPFMSRISPKN